MNIGQGFYQLIKVKITKKLYFSISLVKIIPNHPQDKPILINIMLNKQFINLSFFSLPFFLDLFFILYSISLLQMNTYFLFLYLSCLIFLFPFSGLCATSYLDTRDKSILLSKEYMVSPLGYFKLKLLPNCSMQLQAFNSQNNKYEVSSIFQISSVKPNVLCTTLNLSQQRQAILFNNENVSKELNQSQNQYSRLVMRLNDVGQVYIVKIYSHNQYGSVDQYQKDYLYQSKSSADTRFMYNLSNTINYVNKNNWNFQNNHGAIKVSKSAENIFKNILLSQFQLSEVGFIDPQNETRYAAIPEGKYNPRAGNYSCTQENQGVFAEFDQYWPIVRIYDRDKYLIASYKVDQLKYTICPQKTFDHLGQCLTSCPDPYIKQIRGGHGHCVLNCETGSQIDEGKKICTSSNYESYLNYNYNKLLNRNCPSNSIEYEYGCICSNSLFYDFIQNSCVQKCPSSTFGQKGICMDCNKNCKSCEIDNQKISYLTCSACSEGYSDQRCSVSSKECKNILNCVTCQKNQNSIELCSKCSPFYVLSSNKLSCAQACNQNEVLVVGSAGEAYCNVISTLNLGKPDQFVGGEYLGATYLVRKSGSCPTGQKILRDKCVQSCSQEFDVNSESRCICKSGFATFQNQTCIKISEVEKNLIGYYYNSSYNAFFNCPIGCISCQYNYCLKCSPEHILVATSSSSLCRQRTIHFSCNTQFYAYDSANKLCISNNIIKISNITNCQIELRSKCILCKNNFVLSQGRCISSCPEEYFSFQGKCTKNSKQCSVSGVKSTPITSKVNYQVLNSPVYKIYSQNYAQISNQPVTQVLAIRKFLGLDADSHPQQLNSIIYYPQVFCRVPLAAGKPSSNPPNPNPNPNPNPTPIPNPPNVLPLNPNKIETNCTDSGKPFLLVNGGCVASCIPGTFPFIEKTKNIWMCVTETECYGMNKLKPFQLIDGTCVDACPPNTTPIAFGVGRVVQCQSITDCQKVNRMTPFKLQNDQCSSSCPSGSTPKLTVNGQLLCQDAKTTPPRINIDSSVYQVGSDIGDGSYKIYYFVLDSVLNQSDIRVNYYGENQSGKPKSMVSQTLGQSIQTSPNIVDSTVINNKTYLSIRTTADEVVLDLSKNIKQFQTAAGNRLSSSFYGVKQSQNRLQNTRSWLAIIAFVLSLMLICLHAIYTGNQLIYKVDNFLIFAQSLYYFSFVHLLINSSIGQFYYGFLWSHFGFFPNYFGGTIPPLYMEGYRSYTNSNLPNSYRLLTGDANFIRNAGFSFSLLATFLAAFLIVCGVIFLLKKICGKYEIWYKRIALCALFAGIQFVSMNIFYWAVAHLMYNQSYLFNGYPGEPDNHVGFRTSCSIAAIAWICIYGIYMIIRFIKNKIGGLYMFKRLAFATILAASSYHDNGDNGYKLFLIPMVAAQLIFMILRFVLQKPYLRRQKIFILLESFLMIVAYFVIYLWNDTGFISIYCSLVFFFFIFLFTSDLLDVYLDNKDQFYDDSLKILPGLRHKQFINGDEYQKINNPLSLPDSQRRLKNDKNS